MKTLFATFLATTIITLISCKNAFHQKKFIQNDSLIQILEKGKIGFVNPQGIVVIQPQFLSAGTFAEGLAPVRTNGTYGYIDNTGTFIISPQFDYATSFSEGLAVVYKDGKPFFINKKGEQAFSCDYTLIEPFLNDKASVKTKTERYGVINKRGQLVIDTVFERIHHFTDGLAVVYGIKDLSQQTKTGRYQDKVGIIDSTGKFIVPYGKYVEIQDYENGFFKVEIPALPNDTIEGYTSKTGFIDRTGKLIMSKDYQHHCWISGSPHDGLLIVT